MLLTACYMYLVDTMLCYNWELCKMWLDDAIWYL